MKAVCTLLQGGYPQAVVDEQWRVPQQAAHALEGRTRAAHVTDHHRFADVVEQDARDHVGVSPAGSRQTHCARHPPKFRSILAVMYTSYILLATAGVPVSGLCEQGEEN
jgi:hypothetical protein